MTDPLAPEDSRAGRPGRWLRVALVLSLAVNVAVAGIVLGALMRRDGPRAVAVRDIGFGAFAAALDDEDRRALRRAFVQREPEMRAARVAAQQDMAAVIAALRADPFDPAALRAVLDSSAARTVERLAEGQNLIFAHVAAMSPMARNAFADRLEHALNRPMGPRSGARSDRSGPPGQSGRP